MGMDRNTVIGFVLIGLLMMGMFYFNSQGSKAYLADQKRIEDSLIKARPIKDTAAIKKDSTTAAALRIIQSAGGFQNSIVKPEVLTVVENEVLKITFTSKGGQPKRVELKNYTTYQGKPVVLMQDDAFNKYRIVLIPVLTELHKQPI